MMVIQSFGQTTSSQYSPPLSLSEPEASGMSSERLERISTMLQSEIDEGHIPGAVVLVARKGKIVYFRAFGQGDVSKNRDFTQDDIFRIASQTKAITATAVMILWEEGHFRLDDPISEYIPEFADAQVLDTYDETDTTYTMTAATKSITIRHLLTHTSGIGYGVIDGDPRMRAIYAKEGITDLFTTQPISIEESVKKLAQLPLHHNLGEKFTYSEGLDVLGYFIEIVSGMPFDQFLRERIFDPLGMHDTWFYLPSDRHNRLVPIQHKKGAQWQLYPVTFYDPDYPKKGAKRFFSGGEGLSSTARDYATFLQMYLNDGELNGTRIFSRTTVQFMMANQIGDLWAGGGKYYGLAFGVVNDKGQADGGEGSVGTFDWGGYFNTQYFADPAEDVIGVLMKQTQGANGDQSGWKFRQLVGQAIDD